MHEIALGPVEGGSRQLRGYLARPDGDGPWPAVLAVHELFGPRPDAATDAWQRIERYFATYLR